MVTPNRSSESDARAASPGKEPRTARGRATMRKLLDAAAKEFGDRGFHEASISEITRRAGTALGSFYTYFDSKEAIFSALVRDMSDGVARAAAAGLSPGVGGVMREREVLSAFLAFARDNKAIYRIIDEAEFVDPASYRAHYENAAGRIAARLDEDVAAGLVKSGHNEIRAWAIMGMNVFIGLRYGIWEDGQHYDDVSGAVEELLRDGIAT